MLLELLKLEFFLRESIIKKVKILNIGQKNYKIT